jgi:hypothetical protein
MANKAVLITSTEDIKHLLLQMNKFVVTFQKNAAYGGHIYKLIRYYNIFIDILVDLYVRRKSDFLEPRSFVGFGFGGISTAQFVQRMLRVRQRYVLAA